MQIVPIIIGIAGIVGGILIGRNVRAGRNTQKNLALLGPEAPTLSESGYTFRDLKQKWKTRSL